MRTRARNGAGVVATLVSAALLLVAGGTPAPAATFDAWLAEFRREAARSGISAATLDAALSGIDPVPRVIELDRRQPEGRWTLDRYLERVVTPQRIADGRRFAEEHRALLEPIGREYGVQPRFIVALWGIESDFGRIMGNFQIIPALATLAWDGRRETLFRRELLAALRIVDQGHVSADRMMGSWAGAMGQSQFMPTSFQAYAVDHDGDGRRDIWGTPADVFASIANYLARAGWRGDRTWGRAVTRTGGIPPGGDKAERPLAEWSARGYRDAAGGPLPGADMRARLVVHDGGRHAFLVYGNYQSLLRWNRSNLFATAVGLLSDEIGG